MTDVPARPTMQPVVDALSGSAPADAAVAPPPPPPPPPAAAPAPTTSNAHMCSASVCRNAPRGASGLCKAHGASNRCSEEGCTKSAVGAIGKVIHRSRACPRLAACFCSPLTPFPTCLTRTVKCKAHGGGRRCQYPNCPKSAQGATDRCKAHGGGRRCVYPQCGKSAVGKTHYCKGHGGGRRCNFEGCSKSAQGATWQCIAHGGGRRCKKDGCSKSARGSSNLCM